MKQGISADNQAVDADRLRTSMQMLGGLRDQIAQQAFVRINLGVTDVFTVNVQKMDPTSKNIYQKWMRANQPAIDQIRNDYATKPEQARIQYESLLAQTKIVTPVLVQQALRTGILVELTGNPRGAITVILCPICRRIFETLDERFSTRYEKPK